MSTQLLEDLAHNEIPEGRKQLLESHHNLEKVAEYCEQNYLQANDKRHALEETKNFTTQSLASVAYQINTLANNFLQLLDQQSQHLSELESSVHYLSETVNIHKEKVARREIGLLTTNKSTSRPTGVRNGIIFPEAQERPIKYVRKKIDYSLLDDIGHGVKIQADTRRSRAPSSTSSTYGVGPNMGAPTTKPPTPPSGRGMIAAQPVATPSPPSHYAPNYPMNQSNQQVQQSDPGYRRGPGVVGQDPGYRTVSQAIGQQPDPGYRQSVQQTDPGYRQGLQQKDPGYRASTQQPDPGYSRQSVQQTDPGYRRTQQMDPGYRPSTIGMPASIVGQQQADPGYRSSDYATSRMTMPPPPPPTGIAHPMQTPVLASNAPGQGHGQGQDVPPPPPIDFQGEDMGPISPPLPPPPSGALPPPPPGALPPPPPGAYSHNGDSNLPGPPPTFADDGTIGDDDWIPKEYIQKVVAIYDYAADKADELSFNENQVIYIVKKNDDGWYEGILDGVAGLFPGNYVESCV